MAVVGQVGSDVFVYTEEKKEIKGNGPQASYLPKVLSEYRDSFYRRIANIVRGQFYLPLLHQTLDDAKQIWWDEAHGKRLLNSEQFKAQCKVVPKSIEITCGERTDIFNVRFYETHQTPTHTCFYVCGNKETQDKAVIENILPLLESFSKVKKEGEGLRIIVFTLYGHFTQINNSRMIWMPETIEELSNAPWRVLKALEKHGIKADSLICQSLGNVMMDFLHHLTEDDESIVPPKVVVNRGFTSTKKVIEHLYPYPLMNEGLYHLAKWTRWDADPEKNIRDYYTKSSLNQREVVIIETPLDRFFANKGAFNKTLIPELKEHGVKAFGGSFYVPGILPSAHHSVSLGLIPVSNPGTDTRNFFDLDQKLTLAENLVNYLIHGSDQS